ncbi:1-aminocyclopropane-1-carboxylate synthase-like protein 1 isoform X2 [Littorina saxatilis]|uniref:Aminotransferase class I/classII large domain-containing protein n=1 Tax=Littorina saxatilis TaxID=31220 RepID=A0AAN9BLZ5_9CAEN
MFLMCGAKKEGVVPVDRQPLVCARALRVLSEPGPLVKYSQKVGGDPYDPDNNPKGYIDLGLAENRLCEELTTQKLRSLNLSREDESSLQYYPNLKGLTSFREILADFLDARFLPRKKINPEELVVASGTTAILDTLAFCLADPGDYFMVPAPYYYRIRNDFEDRARVKVLEVPLSPKAGFELTVKSFEIVYTVAKKQGKNIRGLLLINPNNPLGDVYTAHFLIEVLHFAFKNGLHVISDEIYALSVFDKNSRFRSILSLPFPDPERVHFLWGVSKDMGLSGYRCGVLHTCNKHVLQFATAVGIFHVTPPLMQRRLQHILADDDWLDTIYFPTLHKRLSVMYKAGCAKLSEMGVYVHPAKAGIFIWADFSPFLSEHTFAAEQELFIKFLEARIYVLPGKQSYCPYPGWFRIVFASNQHKVMEGLKRMEKVLKNLPSEKERATGKLD